MSYNLLSGVLPSSLGNISGLVHLDLSFNHIEGGIPDSLGNAVLLLSLVANSNRLSGALPSSLRQLGALEEINLDSNQITGSIPKDLCSSASVLVTMRLAGNQVEGFSAPSLLSCPLLTYIDLSRNRIRQSLDFRGATRIPPFVNLAFNELGPELAEYMLPLVCLLLQ